MRMRTAWLRTHAPGEGVGRVGGVRRDGQWHPMRYYLCGVRSLERQCVRDIHRLGGRDPTKNGGDKYTDDMIKWVNEQVKNGQNITTNKKKNDAFHPGVNHKLVPQHNNTEGTQASLSSPHNLPHGSGGEATFRQLYKVTNRKWLPGDTSGTGGASTRAHVEALIHFRARLSNI